MSEQANTGGQHIDERDVLGETCAEMIALAQRQIFIYEPYLMPQLWGQREVLDAVKRFMIRSSRVEARILCVDPDSAIRNGHPIIPLIQSFSGRLQVRRTHERFSPPAWAVTFADQVHWLYRPAHDRITANYHNHPSQRSAEIHSELNGWWEESAPVEHMRVLGI